MGAENKDRETSGERLRNAEGRGDAESIVEELEDRVIEESESRGAAGTPSDRSKVEPVKPDHDAPD